MASIEMRDEERTRCEVWTRVMGYHRPVSAFNPGKRAEHSERQYFREHAAGHRAMSHYEIPPGVDPGAFI